MRNNYFKSVRKSFVASTILTTLMSNLLVFGQPMRQMASKNTFFEDNNSKEKKIHKSTNPNDRKHVPTYTFYAKEKQGSIGKADEADREKPQDNFFTVKIPEGIALENYQVVMHYDLYGLDRATQTTKSINNAPAYGGELIRKKEAWTNVREIISTKNLKIGGNEVFFTRRADKNYQYKIKNLRLELIKNKSNEIVLNVKNLVNYGGNVYYSGFVTNPEIKQVRVGDNTIIEVVDGVFEGVLENLSRDTEKLSFATIDQKYAKVYKVSFSHDEVEIIPAIKEAKSRKLSLSYASLKEQSQQFEAVRLGLNEKQKIKQVSLKNKVTVQGLGFKDLKTVSEEIENVTAGGFLGYRISKANLQDSVSLKLHLNYDPAKIPNGYTAKDVKTYYFDAKKKTWKALPTDSIDYKNKTIISTVTNETDYINGIIKVPENPETSSFVPTSMSDIEFANPAAGVVSIAPPKPNNQGTVNTHFPIKLPKGRKGMQPSLSVNYNSEGGNSWMGMGWNINIPAITLNTKWGVPMFDGEMETELYSLNGQDLVLKYSENGQEKYTNPHRDEGILRGDDNPKQFYLRKEGSYLKIIRKGSNPNDYYWIVEDKFGNKSYYGGIDNVSPSYTLEDSEGNIAHWALLKKEDPYGNYVKYYYDKLTEQEDQNIAINYDSGTYVFGESLYLSKIEYTRKTSNDNNYYRVNFIRTTAQRPDVIINARKGFVEIVANLLKEIEVEYVDGANTQSIRSYNFTYNTSYFGKSLLSKIEEYDSNGVLFYDNTLEYYDDISGNQSGDFKLIDNTELNWEGSPDQISSPLQDIATGGLTSWIPKGSVLGSSTSEGFSSGVRGGVGLGVVPINVNSTVGGSANYSQSTQNTRISFVDINGDGLPDKVLRKSGQLYYRKNNGLNQGFGSLIPISGIDKLSQSKSKTTGWGFDANALGLIGVGKSESVTRGETDFYFSDFNGDGLPDIVGNNRIKFNKTEEGGDYSFRKFEGSSLGSENAIRTGTINLDLVDDLDLETEEELRSQFSQFDHVKVWNVPYSGVINVNSNAKLMEQNNCSFPEEFVNNEFRLTVEHQDVETSNVEIIDSFTLNTNQEIEIDINQLTVEKGDLLYFRIHNLDYGCGGTVRWNPQMIYTSIQKNTETEWSFKNRNIIDENGKKFKKFNAEEDFIMNGGTWKPHSNDTSVNLDFNLNDSDFTINQFSDDINFIIEKTELDNEGNSIGSTKWMRTYNAETGNFTGNTSTFSNDLDPTSKYIFKFYAKSDSNVQWDEILWEPNAASANSGLNYPPVNYQSYNDNVHQSIYWFHGDEMVNPDIDDTIPNGNQTLMQIGHTMFTEDYSSFLGQFNDDDFPIRINWVTKEKIDGALTHVLDKKHFFIDRNTYDFFNGWDYDFYKDETLDTIITSNDIDYYKLNLSRSKVKTINNNGGKIFTALYVDNIKFAKGNTADIILEIKPEFEQDYPNFTSQVLNSPFFSKTPEFFGLPYRGWGQFLYNGGLSIDYDEDGNITGTNYFDDNIDPTVFPNVGQYQNDVEGLEDDINETNPDNVSTGQTVIRYVLYAQDNDSKHYENKTIKDAIYQYRNYSGEQSLIAEIGRFGENNIYDIYLNPTDLIGEVTSQQEQVFVGFKQRTKSKGSAKSGNLGGNFTGGNSFNGTFSEAKSNVLNQYVDLNGDRYPDIATKSTIQYTNMLGALVDANTHVRTNDFIAGSDSSDDTFGATLAGLQSNSTKPSNGKATGNQTRTNVRAGINNSNGRSYNERRWIDMNGDGLTDKVRITTNNIFVNLNTGYGTFTTDRNWAPSYEEDFLTSKRSSNSVGPTFDFNTSYAVGFGAARSIANSNINIIDVNGDGLPDLIRKTGNHYKYNINTGLGFSGKDLEKVFDTGKIEENMTVSGNVFGSATNGFSFPTFIPGIFIKVTGSVSAGLNASYSETKFAVRDINGDGLPDVLRKDSNKSIKAKLNKTGKTHLLKKVNTPLGGRWTVEYERKGNTYNMPQSKWTMSKLETYDGFVGDDVLAPNKSITTFDYENGKYDRRDRSSYGFETVISNQHKIDASETLYRYTVQKYHNQNYYLNGRLKETASYTAGGELLSKTRNFYNLLNPENPVVEGNVDLEEIYQAPNTGNLDRTRLFPALVKTISANYEGQSALFATKEFLAYDSFGNLTKYKDWGPNPEDDYITNITYDTSNFEGLPIKIEVKDYTEQHTLRHREATYNSQGSLKDITIHLNDNQTNRLRFNYDAYGNITEVIQLDNNQNGIPFSQEYEYDNKVKTYPITFSDSYDQESTTQYNYLFGVPVLVTDMNGNSMRTRIDNRGRVIEVTSPKELNNPAGEDWTIRNQYAGESSVQEQLNGAAGTTYLIENAQGSFTAQELYDDDATNSKHFALTKHKVEGAMNNEILTVNIVDGFGANIQLKKSHFTNGNMVWMTSGFEKKDDFGRVIKSYLPVNEGDYGINNLDYYLPSNLNNAVSMEYDHKDRKTKITQPDGFATDIDYTINDNELVTRTYSNDDGLMQTNETYTDVRGRKIKTVQNSTITTEFSYNPINELVEVTNTKGYKTKYWYDIAGRRIKELHPDRGLTKFTYNKVGNLIKKVTSNLMQQDNSGEITYDYNYHRLEKINYSNHPENNVEYMYGDNSHSNINGVGRLIGQKDATGVQWFAYGSLGELTLNGRAIAVAGKKSYWFTTEWEYDSWNRIRTITYPDKEEVHYNYDNAGQLRSITNGNFSANDIVSNISYNKYGEREKITYGNATTTNYFYDNRRRLDKLKQNFNEDVQVIKNYSYDGFSNIKRIIIENDLIEGNNLVGPVQHEYTYDNYNRLIEANGFYVGPNDEPSNLLRQEYSLRMQYDEAHNITSKLQTHVRGGVENVGNGIENPETVLATDYRLIYEDYAAGQQSAGAESYVQPHAPRTITQYPTDYVEGQDNDPRIKKQLIEYDANGNMTFVKEEITDPEEPLGYSEITLKQNLWDDENRLRAVDLKPEAPSNKPEVAAYTYDADGQRIIRYLPGRLDAYYSATAAGNKSRLEAILYPSPLLTVKTLEIPEGYFHKNLRHSIVKYTKHYYIGSERVSSALGTLEPNNLGALSQELLPPINGLIAYMDNKTEIATQKLQEDLQVNFEKELQVAAPFAYGQAGVNSYYHNKDDYEAYWYHPDHLGSSSYITNLDGTITQHMEYLPFGETLVEEHLNSYNSPFKFNAKEYDAETGNYYYGARYYNPKWSIWLSVDKMASRAPQYSPYIYSFNNPVTYFDPDGNWPWPVTIRSFISAGSTGGGAFRGDGRNPSTQSSPTATSRVETSFTADPITGNISKPKYRSDDTVFYGSPNPLNPHSPIPPKSETPEPTASISNKETYENAVYFEFSHSAKDPITPSLLTPDLDVQAGLLMIEDPESMMLSITGQFTGDGFPSTEAFIEDQGGNRLLIGAHKEKGGLGNLFGENKRSTFNVNMMIEYDDNGVFTRIHEGGETYTPQQWEKEVQSRFNGE